MLTSTTVIVVQQIDTRAPAEMRVCMYDIFRITVIAGYSLYQHDISGCELFFPIFCPSESAISFL